MNLNANILRRWSPPSKINDLAKDCDAELVRFMMDEMVATPEERCRTKWCSRSAFPSI